VVTERTQKQTWYEKEGTYKSIIDRNTNKIVSVKLMEEVGDPDELSDEQLQKADERSVECVKEKTIEEETTDVVWEMSGH
jgi:hypothetical protein